jgi:hypothetical protein
LTFGLSLHLPVHFHRSLPGFQFEIDKPWISSPTSTITWQSTGSRCGWWC